MVVPCVLKDMGKSKLSHISKYKYGVFVQELFRKVNVVYISILCYHVGPMY